MLIVLLVSPNTIKEMNRRNKYLTLSHIVEKCVQPKLYTLLRIRKRQNERILIFIPPLKVGDFITRNKARNAFLAQGFLPLGATKLVKNTNICKYGSASLLGLFRSRRRKRELNLFSTRHRVAHAHYAISRRQKVRRG